MLRLAIRLHSANTIHPGVSEDVVFEVLCHALVVYVCIISSGRTNAHKGLSTLGLERSRPTSRILDLGTSRQGGELRKLFNMSIDKSLTVYEGPIPLQQLGNFIQSRIRDRDAKKKIVHTLMHSLDTQCSYRLH